MAVPKFVFADTQPEGTFTVQVAIENEETKEREWRDLKTSDEKIYYFLTWEDAYSCMTSSYTCSDNARVYPPRPKEVSDE